MGVGDGWGVGVAGGVGEGDGVGVDVGEGLGDDVGVGDGLGVTVAVDDGTGVGDALRNVDRGNPSDIEAGSDQATPWGMAKRRTPIPTMVTNEKANRSSRIFVCRGVVFFIFVLARRNDTSNRPFCQSASTAGVHLSKCITRQPPARSG